LPTPNPFYHASDAHAAEGLAALIDEDVGRFDPFSLLLPAQELKTIDLIPLQVMDAIGAALSRRRIMGYDSLVHRVHGFAALER
jgi:hypothetical protein